MDWIWVKIDIFVVSQNISEASGCGTLSFLGVKFISLIFFFYMKNWKKNLKQLLINSIFRVEKFFWKFLIKIPDEQIYDKP